MSAAEIHVQESEEERVARWRVEVLERAGYDSISAAELAARPDVDLHHAIRLLENGCSPELALQILR